MYPYFDEFSVSVSANIGRYFTKNLVLVIAHRPTYFKPLGHTRNLHMLNILFV